MINAKMKKYDYIIYDGENEYGEPVTNEEVVGTVTMAIFNLAKMLNNNITYLTEEFVGITYDKNINDKCVILVGEERLKVKYISETPRNKIQVIMERI